MLKVKILIGSRGTIFRFGKNHETSFFDVKLLNDAAHLWRTRTKRAIIECQIAKDAMKAAESSAEKWYFKSEFIVHCSIYSTCKTMHRLTKDRARRATETYLARPDNKKYSANSF